MQVGIHANSVDGDTGRSKQMSEHLEQPPGLTWTDTGAALVCALIVSLMFSLNQDFPTQHLLSALFLSKLVVPAAFLITVVVALPFLHLVRKRGYTHPLIYVLLPGVLILAVCVLPIVGGPYSQLAGNGKSFIAGGEIVWENFGWYLLYISEPACWASLAGCLFWMMRVRRNRASSRK
ncbi:hypothetical protein [Massilia varians]|uniref:hypothetical protein n=1 Tax=Massilia varians TaxID=457921 RepID=UPI0025576B82|nr:hypothetical protein [Massilia varians]MDK6078133.1 hypothetical protein [Massilia varians]